MSSRHDEMKRRLADLGEQAVRDDEELRQALADDAELRAFWLALQEVDSQLAQLPAIEPPADLVEQALARVATSVAGAAGATVEDSAATAMEASPTPPAPDTQELPAVDRDGSDPDDRVRGWVTWVGEWFRAYQRPLVLASACLLILLPLTVSLFYSATLGDAERAADEVAVGAPATEDDWTGAPRAYDANAPSSVTPVDPAPQGLVQGRTLQTAEEWERSVDALSGLSSAGSSGTPEPWAGRHGGGDSGALAQGQTFVGGQGGAAAVDPLDRRTMAHLTPSATEPSEPSIELRSSSSGRRSRGEVANTPDADGRSFDQPTARISERTAREGHRRDRAREVDPEPEVGRHAGPGGDELQGWRGAANQRNLGDAELEEREEEDADYGESFETARVRSLPTGSETPTAQPVPSNDPRVVIEDAPVLLDGQPIDEGLRGRMQAQQRDLEVSNFEGYYRLDYNGQAGVESGEWEADELALIEQGDQRRQELDNLRWNNEADDPDAFTYQAGEDVTRPGFATALRAGDLERAMDSARRLLAERERIEGLVFREPRGYWANTYVPGDPVLRELQRRLRESGGGAVAYGSSSALALAHASEAVAQPFDPPTTSAMAVYLNADRAQVQGQNRVLLQVGLQGTARQPGRRPAMNIGVVLDLRDGLSPSNGASVRALLEALSEARDIGDQICLVVAGVPGGLVIEPGHFRYGPVSVLTRQLLEGESLTPAGEPHPTLDLVEAAQMALETVRTGDDPTAPLGSSLLLLVTAGDLSGPFADLRALSHGSAVDGIPMSVVGVGETVDLGQLDELALAGQGNRRLLREASEAEDVIDRELSAASRVVARALRLRIRLAPGVQLVDVLGSYRLDEVRADEVRRAERSIDQRLARNLGIQADRGEDEDGIQIVIPAFYADDAHVILLDLVVPGPGPVADVRLRYKDLVHLRNGVSRDNLALRRGDNGPGPLQLNVFRNLVAWELSQALRLAGRRVAVGQFDHAEQLLLEQLELLHGLQAMPIGFASDPGIEADITMLADYVRTLAGGGVDLQRPNELADSLLYAGVLKVLAVPDEAEELE